MRRGAACGLLGLLLALGVVAPAYGATITVNTELDSGVDEGRCSLREAVSAANLDSPSGAAPGECAAGSGTDLIAVPAGLYSLNDVLLIDSDLSMVGAGAASTVLSQAAAAQVVSISNGRTVTLDSITITGGRASAGSNSPFVSGAPGSGANATGGPGAPGSHGGGILNGTGQLTILRSRISGNRAGAGGNGGSAAGGSGASDNGSAACLEGGDATGGSGGPGGSGGGIYSIGPLTVRDSVISANFAGTGGAGGFATGGRGGNGGTAIANGCLGGTAVSGPAGAGGGGGGIAAQANLVVERSVIADNRAGAGGQTGTATGGAGGTGAASPAGSGGFGGAATGGTGGSGGGGGGILVIGGTATIGATSFTRNEAGTGGGGAWGTGGDGGFAQATGRFGGGGGAATGGAAGVGGSGGAILGGAPVEVARTLMTANRAGMGGVGGRAGGGVGGGAVAGSTVGAGGAATSGAGGAGGSGGALRINDDATVTDTTVSGNGGGGGGNGGFASGGFSSGGTGFASAGSGGAAGVAAIRAGTQVLLRGVTIASNDLDAPGQPGGRSAPGADGSAGAEGIGAISGGGTSAVTVAGSVIASNAPATCTGPLIDGGDNIVLSHTGCPGTQGDPKLGPLAGNGGPTQTHALGAGSAALDAVPAGDPNCTGSDQRGVTRPRGAACDAGAYERAAPQAATGAAESVTPNTARLTASVIANGRATSVRFEYGRTPNLGSLTGTLDAGAALTAAGVGAHVSGLEPGATYHYRVVASSADGASAGVVRTFTTPADRSAPVISRASISPRRFAVRGRARGARVRFRLSENAALVLEVRRLLPGRLAGRRCAPPSRANRKGRRCKRRKLAGRIRAIGAQGANSVRFRGRIRGSALRPGSYELTLRATDAAGNRAAPKRLTFKIVR